MNEVKNNKIYLSLAKVSSWTGLSRIFGLIRDVVTTNLLGASVFHDIFVVTLKIPNLFRRFFAEGAFNQAFIPIYSDYQKGNDEKNTQEFINSLAGSFLSILFLFTIKSPASLQEQNHRVIKFLDLSQVRDLLTPMDILRLKKLHGNGTSSKLEKKMPGGIIFLTQ